MEWSNNSHSFFSMGKYILLFGPFRLEQYVENYIGASKIVLAFLFSYPKKEHIQTNIFPSKSTF